MIEMIQSLIQAPFVLFVLFLGTAAIVVDLIDRYTGIFRR